MVGGTSVLTARYGLGMAEEKKMWGWGVTRQKLVLDYRKVILLGRCFLVLIICVILSPENLIFWAN